MTQATITEALRRLYVDAAHTDDAGHVVDRIADPAADLIDELVKALNAALDIIDGFKHENGAIADTSALHAVAAKASVRQW